VERQDRPTGGKIPALTAFLEAYGSQVAADLWHHYHGLDLRDLWRPGGGRSKLTFRLLQDLIDHLPPESATKTAVRDAMPEEALLVAGRNPDASYGPWSRQDFLLAAIADRLSWVIYAVYRSCGGNPNEPTPYPRPGVSRKGAVSPRAFAYMEARRAAHRRRQQAAAQAKQPNS